MMVRGELIEALVSVRPSPEAEEFVLNAAVKAGKRELIERCHLLWGIDPAIHTRMLQYSKWDWIAIHVLLVLPPTPQMKLEVLEMAALAGKVDCLQSLLRHGISLAEQESVLLTLTSSVCTWTSVECLLTFRPSAKVQSKLMLSASKRSRQKIEILISAIRPSPACAKEVLLEAAADLQVACLQAVLQYSPNSALCMMTVRIVLASKHDSECLCILRPHLSTLEVETVFDELEEKDANYVLRVYRCCERVYQSPKFWSLLFVRLL